MIRRTLAEFPKPLNTYPKIIKSMVINPNKGKKTLPEVEYSVKDFQVDPKHLAAYEAVCGFKPSEYTPSTYFGVLSQSLQMAMMANEAFPFPIVGLVHIRNDISQYRPVKVSETLNMSCAFGPLKPHEKGLEFDFIFNVASKDGDDVVEGKMTYLIRQKVADTGNKKPIPEIQALPNPVISEEWKVPENIGRRYAAASGDFNLIHLHALTAKLFGFSQAIAHGMWTNAHCLAEMYNKNMVPPSYKMVVHFKLPVLLPATVKFEAWKTNDDVKFALNDKLTGKPHIDGDLHGI